jgi:arylsulfatase
MDRDVGRILALLKELGLDDHTLVLFSSDNGPTYAGGVDYAFFNSAGPLRGLKGSLYEGGIRVPMIARWPGKIRPGGETDHASAFWDVMPTLAEIAGIECPGGVDGISFAPTLLNHGNQENHPFLYWEFSSYQGQQTVRMGDWKGVRQKMQEGSLEIELYNLKDDPGESDDVSAQYPKIVQEMKRIMREARVPSERFPFEILDRM